MVFSKLVWQGLRIMIDSIGKIIAEKHLIYRTLLVTTPTRVRVVGPFCMK